MRVVWKWCESKAKESFLVWTNWNERERELTIWTKDTKDATSEEKKYDEAFNEYTITRTFQVTIVRTNHRTNTLCNNPKKNPFLHHFGALHLLFALFCFYTVQSVTRALRCRSFSLSLLSCSFYRSFVPLIHISTTWIWYFLISWRVARGRQK